MKFLVVDDSKVARARVIDYLKDMGYSQFEEAEDGLIAVEKYKTFNPDIMVIDLEMPNMKGNQASQVILNTIDTHAKIILATSIIDKKEIIIAQRIGIAKVITKPFVYEEFKILIEQLSDK